MSTSLHYAPIKWSHTCLFDTHTPYAFTEILDVFDVEYYATDDNEDESIPMDYEVEREGLKNLRIVLVSGDFTEEQDEVYRRALKAMKCTHDDFLKALSDMLSVKTDWIRVAWF